MRTYSTLDIGHSLLNHAVGGALAIRNDVTLVLVCDCEGCGEEDESANGELHFLFFDLSRQVQVV